LAARRRAEVADLDGRIAELDESVRGRESDLDIRLSKMASNTVIGARIRELRCKRSYDTKSELP
jgi:hypothetical protein